MCILPLLEHDIAGHAVQVQIGKRRTENQGAQAQNAQAYDQAFHRVWLSARRMRLYSLPPVSLPPVKTLLASGPVLTAGIETMPSRANSALSASAGGVGGGQQLFAIENGIGAGQKHRAWVSALISSRPADRRTMLLGMVMRATAMVRTKSMGSSACASATGVPPQP